MDEQKNMNDDQLNAEANRLLLSKLQNHSIYLRVFILSGGEVFPELETEFRQLWSECVEEAVNSRKFKCSYKTEN